MGSRSEIRDGPLSKGSSLLHRGLTEKALSDRQLAYCCLALLGHLLLGQHLFVVLLSGPGDQQCAAIAADTGERLDDLGSLILGQLGQLLSRTGAAVVGVAMELWSMDQQIADSEIVHDHAHAVDVVAVGMSREHEINRARPIVRLNMRDHFVAGGSEASVDDPDHPIAAARIAQAHGDRVAALPFLGHC